MKRMKRTSRIGALAIVIVIVSTSVLFISSSNDDFKLVKGLEIYYSLFRELNMFYVDETNPEKLIESSIQGMLKELDPYTSFIPESESDNFNFMTTGQYGGIGSLIRANGEFAIIAEPYEGFPAAETGLLAGDTILSIDGKEMKNKAVSYISDHLKGKPGTDVNIVVRRLGHASPIEKTLKRQKITINNVPYSSMINEHTGYIRLANFTTGAALETKSALMDLKQNPGFNSLILDLRGNPGGLLIEAVDVANIFVNRDQEIVRTRGRVKQWDHEYRTRHMPVDTLVPIVVLVSRGSASASEIVAGALQDLDRAIVVGQRTFGKGLVQTTRELSYNARLKITTAKYYIPSGRCIQALDYSHRNEDGSVGSIPDSLISEYSTKNGRKVYDGGGIQPDFEIDTENLSQLTISLLTHSLIFDFATIYVAGHEKPDDFEYLTISDEIYDEFSSFVASRDFTYETRSEETLDKLIETAKQEKYYDFAQDDLQILKAKLAHDNMKDLNNFQDEIKQFLKEEIAVRYYYQKGRMRATLEHDSGLTKAIDVLEQTELYLSTLGISTIDAHAIN
jgi:carboxyl-terminal processing protease